MFEMENGDEPRLRLGFGFSDSSSDSFLGSLLNESLLWLSLLLGLDEGSLEASFLIKSSMRKDFGSDLGSHELKSGLALDRR